jgi:hypothetical protein
MDVGIVGPPRSGRTTVFRALLAHRAPQAAGKRGGAGSVGAVHVRDARLERLGALAKRERVVPIEIRVHDLCSSLEERFPKAEVEQMKRMDLLLLVIAAFADPAPEASAGALERLASELCLLDLAAVEDRLERAKREKIAEGAKHALEHARSCLEQTRPVFAASLSRQDEEELRGYALVTQRPWIAICNVAEAQVGAPLPPQLLARASELRTPALSLCAALEAETAELPPQEQRELLREYGVQESAGAVVTRAALERADRISFFTVGDDECRAWAIPRGTPARAAAGRVHSDMERGFIRAEVIPFEELEKLPGGLGEARKSGRLRLEGQDYVVHDGDVIRFRFNV